MVYYRYERIVQDIAVFCERIVKGQESDKDRAQSLRFMKSNFLAGGVLEIARKTEEKMLLNLDEEN